jgi:hypothetical protein
MAIDSARRTRTSLNGGRSWASASPNGVIEGVSACTMAAGFVLRTASTSDALCSGRKSL